MGNGHLGKKAVLKRKQGRRDTIRDAGSMCGLCTHGITSGSSHADNEGDAINPGVVHLAFLVLYSICTLAIRC